MALKIEHYIPGILEYGFQTRLPLVQGHRLIPTISTGATITATQAAAGYIISTVPGSATLTLPTGTLLGTQLGAEQGVVFDLVIDNTAAAGVVTIATGTNAILADVASATLASGASTSTIANPMGKLTIATGASGIGRFTLMFSSSTAYVFTRTA